MFPSAIPYTDLHDPYDIDYLSDLSEIDDLSDIDDLGEIDELSDLVHLNNIVNLEFNDDNEEALVKLYNLVDIIHDSFDVGFSHKYSKGRQILPFVNQLLSRFVFMESQVTWTYFLQNCYQNFCVWLPNLYTQMEFVTVNDPYDTEQLKFLALLIKNIETFCMNCVDNSMSNFAKLPGHVPLELKTHIVGFIATAPTKF